MDIQFRENEDDPDALVFSQPVVATVYINPTASWSEVMKVGPTYDQNEAESTSIVNFMIKALGWEALVLSVFRSQGWSVMISLDDVCGTKRGFYDMFLGIHH